MRKSLLKSAAAFCMISAMIFSSNIAEAQQSKEKLKAVNRKVTVDKQSGAVQLNEMDKVGIAWLIGKEFTTGTIEFDLKGKDELQGSFLGIAFHGMNDSSYEAVYFRPFNFRATDPLRKSHGVQYIASPKFDWPKLRSEFPNQYEQPVSSDIDPNQWFHVKIVVAADKIRVYANEKTVLELKPLVKTKGKMIGYWAGDGSGGEWKNLKIY